MVRLRSAVTLIKGTERLLCFVCCWFPVSVYKYYVLRQAVTIQWTATEHPHWGEQKTHQILIWRAEITVGLSRISLSAVSAGFTFIKRFGVRLLESNWNAATRETTVTIAMLLPRPSAFEAVLQTLQLVTFPGKFPEQHAFSTQRRGCLCLSHRQESQKISTSARRTGNSRIRYSWDGSERNKAILKNYKQVVVKIMKNPG